MVELRTIRIAGVNRSFEAAWALAAVAGMALVAIQDSDANAVMVRQGFISLQAIIDMVNPLPQAFGLHQGVHTPDTVGAAYGLTEPVMEKAGASREFQSIETAHAGPEQNCDGLDDKGSREARLQSPVDDAGDDCLREPEDLFGISDQAAENGQRFLARRRFHSSSETSSRRR